MIDPHIFEFPLSLILVGIVIAILVVSRNTVIARFLCKRAVSASLISIAAILTAVEGTWCPGLFHHWTFIAVVLLIIMSLGFTVIRDFEGKSAVPFLSHFGLFLVLIGGLLGSTDVEDAHIQLFYGQKEHMTIDSKGYLHPLPFEMELKAFDIDLYDDGASPKQFTSTLTIDGRDFSTSVNHPCRYKGYRIYQSGYDMESGEYSILKVVRDPWLPLLAIGAVFMFIASALSLKKTWNSWKILFAAVALGAVFTGISLAKISFGTLMPALRSLWFIPHIAVYMLAYAILAFAAIAGITSFFSRKFTAEISRKLLSTASSLLLVGMICGAVWAKQAWGDYWTWDSKECWAAVTWLLTLVGTHIGLKEKKLAVVFAVVAFLAMQITWYGVNYLPSSSMSLHTYNQRTAR